MELSVTRIMMIRLTVATLFLSRRLQPSRKNVLDGRIRAGKKTIISTNLDDDGIAERYGAALASRLKGEYEWLPFRGRDIRELKKELR